MLLLALLLACSGVPDTSDTGDTMPFPSVVAGPDAADRNFRYSVAKDFVLDISPWNGWVPDYHQGVDVNPTATPPELTSATDVDAYLYRGVPLVPHNSTDDPQALQTIKTITIRYRRAAAADTLVFNVYKALKDGTGAGSAVVTYTEAAQFTTTGAWTTYTGSPALVIDPDYVYFMRLVLGPTSTPAAADVKVGPCTMTITRDGVE